MMKHLNKYLSLALALVLCLSLAACGAVVNPPGGNTGSGSAANGKDNATTAGEIKIVMGHAGNDNLADGIMSLKFNELIAESGLIEFESGLLIVIESRD